MNPSVGKKTKGLGSSFKGALAYYLHDKRQEGAQNFPQTSARVGFVATDNLFTDDPHQAWREMMLLVDCAGELKSAAGIKAGRKLKKPVLCYAVNWHPDDRPSAEHMLQTARDSVRMLGLQEHQAVFVQHTDEAHPHVHILINRVHPVTGIAAEPAHWIQKLDQWADRYELAHGVIRSPERRAKYAALAQGISPERPEKWARNREEWQARKDAANDNPARSRAQEIKAAQAAQYKKLVQENKQLYERQKRERNQIYLQYNDERNAAYAETRPEIYGILKHSRNRYAMPFTRQGIQDWRETREWRSLGRQLHTFRRTVMKSERSMSGRLINAARIAAKQGGGMRAFFDLARHGDKRQAFLDRYEQQTRKALADRQYRRRLRRAQPHLAARDALLVQAQQKYKQAQTELKSRHMFERIAAQKKWQEMRAQRDIVWQQFKRDFPQTGLELHERITGRIVNHGPAPYRNRAGERASYFITIEREDGTRATLWGAAIRDTLKASPAKGGEIVTIQNLGRQPKTIYRPVLDKQGNRTGWDERVIEQTQFHLSRTGQMQDKARRDFDEAGRNDFRQNIGDMTAPPQPLDPRKDFERAATPAPQEQKKIDEAREQGEKRRRSAKDRRAELDAQKEARQEQKPWKERGKERKPRQRDKGRGYGFKP